MTNQPPSPSQQGAFAENASAKAAGDQGSERQHDNNPASPSGGSRDARVKTLSPEAQRALAEAAERRKVRDENPESRETEISGQEGPDPVRYGDWEKGGIASDF